MTWKLIRSPKTVKLTKQFAKEFSEMDPAPHDRPLSPRRISVYQKLLDSGAFRPVTWASAACTETGGKYRVNGKHTSTMFAELDKLPEFFVTLEEYQCDSLEDVARLYATFDSKMMSRTTRDINLSFAATIPELAEVPSSIVNLSVAGISYAKWGQDTYNHQPAERAECLLDHPLFITWLSELLTGGAISMKQKMGLVRMPVAAAIYTTYNKAKGAALEFWSSVRDETGHSPSTPDRKLARYLATTGLIGGDRAKRTKAVSGNREIFVKCIHAWNAWRKGELTNLNYHATAKIPAIN
jgi:hypothetical protein